MAQILATTVNQPLMSTMQCLCVHFFHHPVVGQETVDLNLHIGCLGVDGGGQSLLDERFKLVFQ